MSEYLFRIEIFLVNRKAIKASLAEQINDFISGTSKIAIYISKVYDSYLIPFWPNFFFNKFYIFDNKPNFDSGIKLLNKQSPCKLDICIIKS